MSDQVLVSIDRERLRALLDGNPIGLAAQALEDLQAALDDGDPDPVGIYVRTAAVAQQMVDLGFCREGPKLREAKEKFREALASIDKREEQ